MPKKLVVLEDEAEKEDNSKSLFLGANRGSDRTKFHDNRSIKKRGLAASEINTTRSILTRDQLLACAEAYMNNGIVRVTVDKAIHFAIGTRPKVVIEANDELTEGMSEEQLDQIVNQLLESNSIRQLKRKIIRINKRVELQDNLSKWLAQVMIFGRAFLLIHRFPKDNIEDDLEEDDTEIVQTKPIPKPSPDSRDNSNLGNNNTDRTKLTQKEKPQKIDPEIQNEIDSIKDNPDSWLQFGEPEALQLLTALRVKEIKQDNIGRFKGIFYDTGKTNQEKKLYKDTQLIAGWYDDNNLFDNTRYSGMSLVWTILPVAQTIDVINDEDLPEISKQLWAKFMFVYAGDSRPATIRQLRDEFIAGTALIHNKKDLTAEVFDQARNPEELTNVRDANGKYIVQSMGQPLFSVYENTTNFATANQVMQVYKEGTLKRTRTWLQGVLEKYWYDPILADHLNITLEEVIRAPIRIKVVFDDINFEPREAIINEDKTLVEIGVLKPSDVADDIGEDEISRSLKIREREMQAVDDELEQTRKEALMDALKNPPPQQTAPNDNNNGGTPKKGQNRSDPINNPLLDAKALK